MKKLIPTALALFLSFAFVSCETQEEPVDGLNKLDSYKIARDEFGKFRLEHVTVDGFETELVNNYSTNTSEIYFNESAVSSTKYQNELKIQDNEVKIGFMDVEGTRSEFISVEDDDITSAEFKGGNPLLRNYYVHKTFSGSYVVFFRVIDGVEVSYSYNEELGENEITLNKTEGKRIFKNVHAQVYNRGIGEPLLITFVCPMDKGAAKGFSSSDADTSLDSSLIRRPKIIIAD
ncbi:hypothetical protein N9L20_07160 [Flavobacteriaceae bacterium]|nr:hypothetical protein [Flavobacteriaceae bacterium]